MLMTQRYYCKIMRYLIDTNILIYAVAEPDLLSNDVAAIIAEPDTVLYITLNL